MNFKVSGGGWVTTGSVLGSGGEATIYAVVEDPTFAAKRYAIPSSERAAKLQLMIDCQPHDPVASQGHTSICWPTSLLIDSTGVTVGFLMPRIDSAKSLPLFEIWSPKSRRTLASGFSWKHLARIGSNLASVVAEIHAKGYVIGDLNESNVLVSDRALVSIVDCDSMQVRNPKDGTIYRCLVGKPDFTAPELVGHSFQNIYRTQEQDLFALAVMLFMLLMEGTHPFSGVWRAGGDPPPIEDRIRLGASPYVDDPRVQVMPGAPPFSILDTELQGLFKRAFGLGAKDPSARPNAREWQEVLASKLAALNICKREKAHLYSRHLPSCPWCERNTLIGSNPFPGSQPRPVNPTPIVPTTKVSPFPSTLNLGHNHLATTPTPAASPNLPTITVPAYGHARGRNWVLTILGSIPFIGVGLITLFFGVIILSIFAGLFEIGREIYGKKGNPPQPAITTSQAQQQIDGMLTGWAGCHRSNDAACEASFYAPEVSHFFRHRNVSRSYVHNIIASAISRSEQLTLYRIENVVITMHSPINAGVSLEKVWASVSGEGKIHHTQSQLGLSLINGVWLISSEQDIKDRVENVQNTQPAASDSSPKEEADPALPAPAAQPPLFRFNIANWTAVVASEHLLQFNFVVQGVGEWSRLASSAYEVHPVADGQELSNIKIYSRTLGMFDEENRGTILFFIESDESHFDRPGNADSVCNYLNALHPNWTAFRFHNVVQQTTDFSIPCVFAQRPK